MPKLTGAFFAAGLLAIAASAHAEGRVERSVGSTAVQIPAVLDAHLLGAMLAADRDQDGMLTRDELAGYDAAMVSRFADADEDGNGRLTLFEFETLLIPPPAQRAAAND